MGKEKKSQSKMTNRVAVGSSKKYQKEQLEDRFTAAETRPQFRAPKSTTTKVVLDERFSSVLTDPKFQLQEKDKYGRKKNKKQRQQQNLTAKEELKAFYVVQNNHHQEKEDEQEDKRAHNNSNDQLQTFSSSSNNNNNSAEQNEKGDDPVSRIAYLTALSRGELEASSTTDEDDFSQSSVEEEEEEREGEDPVYGTAGILDPSYHQQEEDQYEISYVQNSSSPYLVVTNMDWENVRAVDLLAVLSSFAPPGAIKKVQVYQSNFGIEKMEKDQLYGPTDIWKKKKYTRIRKRSEGPQQIDETTGSSSDENEILKQQQQDSSDSDVDESEEPQSKVQFDDVGESDFDPEKLRAYEAAKLKYFFAIVEFLEAEHADLVYQEVDGMEFERSSAAMDLRTISPEEVPTVTSNRPMRDEATSIPGNYQPPDFVVSALQQTNIQCTWDQGDTERERKLTKYASSGWRDEYEHNDLKAYLASDASSDDDDDSDDEDKAAKASKMRKLLGLDSDDDADDDDVGSNKSNGSHDDDEASTRRDSTSKEMKYVPGMKDLEDKIRFKLASEKDEAKESTPWEKYQEKRKQKRKERKLAARGRNKREDSDESDDNSHDPRGKSGKNREKRDDFFMDKCESDEKDHVSHEKARQELELLLAGEHEEEQNRDYDIRGIQRVEKNKGKILKGSRKRKEAKIAADVSGTDFKVNVHDERFKSVLDGSDDRFGIDKTDPSFKDTSAMREILNEQTKRRRKKRQNLNHPPANIVPDVNSESARKTVGASALSSLVQRLKSRVES
jgi:hypothetical protein